MKKPALGPKVVLHHARERLARQPMIRALEYAVTYACQATCAKCSAATMHDPSRTRLDATEQRALGDACHALGCYEVNFTGGEPLLDPDLEAIVGRFHPGSTFIGINTNGERLDRARIRSLRDAGVDLLKISLDSVDPRCHDRSRGIAGLYRHIVDVLRMTREEPGIRGHLCMVTTREAIEAGEVERALDLVHRHDATLGIVLPAAVGGWSRKHEVLLEPRHRRALSRLGRDPAVFLQGNVGQGRFVCPCGTREIYVSCYGDVIPCPFIQIAFGNTRDEPFEAIYARMAGWKTGENRRPVCSSAEDPAFRSKYVDPIAGAPHTPVQHRDHPAWKDR